MSVDSAHLQAASTQEVVSLRRRNWAAERATPAQLAELRHLATEMEKTLAAGDLLGHLPLASRFHKIITEAANHEFIEQFLGMLHAPLIRHQFHITLVPGRKDEALVEHREILSALEHQDAARAEQAMRQHRAQLCRSLQQVGHLPIG